MVKWVIFGQTAKLCQRHCLFHISNIGIKNKLTKQTVKILPDEKAHKEPSHLDLHCLQMCVRVYLMCEFTRLYPICLPSPRESEKFAYLPIYKYIFFMQSNGKWTASQCMFYVLRPLSCVNAVMDIKVTDQRHHAAAFFKICNHAIHQPLSSADNMSRQFWPRYGLQSV